MKIKVVGMGGIGTCLIHPLCRFLNHTKFDSQVNLTIIDGDHYEEQNKSRQWFTELGNKAEVTVKSICSMYPNINFFAAALFVTTDNVIRSVREAEILLLCLDNDNSRKIITDRCKELKDVVVICGGNELTSGTVQTWVRRKGKDITLPLDNEIYGFRIAKPQDDHPTTATERAGCETQIIQKGEAQTIIANNAVAASMLNAFYALLQNQLDYDIVYVDCLTNRMASRKNNRPNPIV